MDKRELKQLYYLNREIMNATEELVEMKIKARDNQNYLPNGADREKIAEYEAEIVKKIRQCSELKERINKFLNTIDDSLTRQIFYYRYVKSMSWRKVAYMTGGFNSEDGVRKISERYLKKHCDDTKG